MLHVVLSARKGELVTLLAAGHSDETVARKLQISRRSVTYALRTLMDQLGVDSRFQLGLALGALRTSNLPSTGDLQPTTGADEAALLHTLTVLIGNLERRRLTFGREDNTEQRGALAEAASKARTLADLGALLRLLRNRQGRRHPGGTLTYRTLAARLGSSHGIIGEYLAGRVLPPPERFDALILLLGASPAELGPLATARDNVEERRRRPKGATTTPAGRRRCGC